MLIGEVVPVQEILQETRIKMEVQAREYFIEVFSTKECYEGVLEREWEKLLLYTLGKQVIKKPDMQEIDIGQVGA